MFVLMCTCVDRYVCVSYSYTATMGVMLCSWEGNSMLWKSWSAVCNAETSLRLRTLKTDLSTTYRL